MQDGHDLTAVIAAGLIQPSTPAERIRAALLSVEVSRAAALIRGDLIDEAQNRLIRTFPDESVGNDYGCCESCRSPVRRDIDHGWRQAVGEEHISRQVAVDKLTG